MRRRDRLAVGWKALTQLGPEQVGLNALYRFGLVSGHYRRATATPGRGSPGKPARWRELEGLGERLREHFRAYPQAAAELLAEADEVKSGRARLFGAQPVALHLEPPAPLAHWTEYERGRVRTSVEDIKFLWEPARFGWALTLARAYLTSDDIGYAKCFWTLLNRFLQANPPYQGPNWSSGQEAGIRLMTLTLAGQTLRAGAEENDEAGLAETIAAHAERIPPTMIYARSQHNNHLLTEAAGLLTAAAFLPEHPRAGVWLRLGWQWLNRGLQEQIDADGSYAQHSANYHRLMLQTALWGQAVGRQVGLTYPQKTAARLAAATRWLMRLTDRVSGRAANFGANDGAYLFPLGPGGFEDYRPTLQAAARAFLGGPVFPAGPWDEMSLWFGLEMGGPRLDEAWNFPDPSHAMVGRLENGKDWAVLRAAQFNSRPGQADQLHVDIWHGGQPVTLDAGAYRYTADFPWENALAGARAHNTVMVDDQEPMRRAGKFLWLDWDQARWLETSGRALEAERDGYRRLGILHRRRLEWVGAGGWLIIDRMLPVDEKTRDHDFTLHWLLPDWDWVLEGNELQLEGPECAVQVQVEAGAMAQITLIRAGQPVAGEASSHETLGWVSPTYGVKRPALSLVITIENEPSLEITTKIQIRSKRPGK